MRLVRLHDYNKLLIPLKYKKLARFILINSTSKICTAVWKKLAEKITRLRWILWMQNVFVVFVRFGGATAALAATLGRQRCIGWKTELRVSFLTFCLHQPAGKGIILTVATRWCHVLHLYEELMINLACRTHIHKHTRTQTHKHTHAALWGLTEFQL